jgi:hypothetical protein
VRTLKMIPLLALALLLVAACQTTNPGNAELPTLDRLENEPAVTNTPEPPNNAPPTPTFEAAPPDVNDGDDSDFQVNFADIESVAEALLRASFNGDLDALSKLVCAEGATFLDELDGGFGPGGADRVELDYSGLVYTVTDQDGNDSVLAVTGSLGVTVSVTGQPTVTQQVPLDDVDMLMRNEGGQWKFCGSPR